MKQPSISHTQILDYISQADGPKLDELEKAIIQRYAALFPQWETISLSLPKDDPETRRRIFQFAFESVEKSINRP